MFKKKEALAVSYSKENKEKVGIVSRKGMTLKFSVF